MNHFFLSLFSYTIVLMWLILNRFNLGHFFGDFLMSIVILYWGFFSYNFF
ncbi:MAG: hypothetical protein PG977_001127 [Bartonella clarridgeiae]|nr:MAG: hypothetical protein PG977_001127 [Bartonella clarridgeiae]